MNKLKLLPVRASLLLAAATLSLACKSRAEEPAPTPAPSTAALPPSPAKAAILQRARVNPEDVPANKLVKVGETVESSFYYFTLKDIRLCSAEEASAGGGGDAGSSAASGQDGSSSGSGETVVVGALVQIEAKVRLFVAPRDLRLKTGGVIFQSKPLTEAPKGCGPLLKPHHISSGTHAKGMVVFELPKARAKDLLLDYKPTRWGGAGRVGVKIPPLEALFAAKTQ